MTYTIAPESPRREEARRIGRILTEALRERGISKRELAFRLTGHRASRSSIQLWARGDSVPTLETAQRLDAILGTSIARHVIASRIVTCQNGGCGKRIIVRGNRHRTRYCSPACAKQAAKVRSALQPKADTLARRLEFHRRAVAAFCEACRPDGVCRAVECELRPISPLPLAGAAS